MGCRPLSVLTKSATLVSSLGYGNFLRAIMEPSAWRSAFDVG
jgi:hypothetical protein